MICPEPHVPGVAEPAHEPCLLPQAWSCLQHPHVTQQSFLMPQLRPDAARQIKYVFKERFEMPISEEQV